MKEEQLSDHLLLSFLQTQQHQLLGQVFPPPVDVLDHPVFDIEKTEQVVLGVTG